MALELIDRTAIPEAGGYKSTYVQYALRKGTAHFTGEVTLPGKFATLTDNEVLDEVKRQIAIQMYEGESTPSLVTEYANLNKQIGILANGKEDREKALRKLVNKVNKGNDKLLMTLMLDVLDAKTINDNRDVIIDAFDSYEIGVEYSVGDKFKYDNRLFEVIEDHTSVEVWKPTSEPTKYKELSLTREENKEADLEDENGRYVTRGQLNDAMAGVFQAVMKAVEEMFEEEEGGEENGNTEHNSNGISHNEGGTESNETK